MPKRHGLRRLKHCVLAAGLTVLAIGCTTQPTAPFFPPKTEKPTPEQFPQYLTPQELALLELIKESKWAMLNPPNTIGLAGRLPAVFWAPQIIAENAGVENIITHEEFIAISRIPILLQPLSPSERDSLGISGLGLPPNHHIYLFPQNHPPLDNHPDYPSHILIPPESSDASERANPGYFAPGSTVTIVGFPPEDPSLRLSTLCQAVLVHPERIGLPSTTDIQFCDESFRE